MSDPVEWLNGCLKRAEQRAQAADEGPWGVGTLRGAFWSDGSPAYPGDDMTLDDEGVWWPKPGEVRGSHVYSKPADGGGRMIADMSQGSRCEANADHIADYDPPWRLADIARKRKILDEHQAVLLHKASSGPGYHITVLVCRSCGGTDALFPDGTAPPGRPAAYPCRTVRLLASEFAGEPGYDERWRP